MLPKFTIGWMLCVLGVGFFCEAIGSNTESLPNCDGKCVQIDVPCVSTSEVNPCGKESKCCQDITPDAASTETRTTQTFEDEAPEFLSLEAETEMRFMSFMDGRSPRDWGSFSSESDETSQAPSTGWGSFDDPSTESPLTTSPGSPHDEATGWGAFTESTRSPVTLSTPEGTFHEPVNSSSGRSFWTEENAKCPGMCMPQEQISFCGRPFPLKSLCENGEICCLTEIQSLKIKLLTMQNATDEVPDGRHEIKEIFQSGSFGDLRDLHCPYTCVLPSNAVGCTVLNYFYCPGESMCCMAASKPENRRTQCGGSCLAHDLHNLCRPPRTLFFSQACKPPLLCCDSKDAEEWSVPLLEQVQPPFYAASGNEYFYVSAEREFFELESLPPDAIPFHGENPELESLPVKVWFLRDPTSDLWKRYGLLTKASLDDLESAEKLSRTLLTEDQTARITCPDRGTLEFVIPDEEDLPQQYGTGNLGSTMRPPCPGSCLSYFTRFMCFRNYTTYDGFHCPGKRVCCAKVEDVKKHEVYLKNLYPYLQNNLRHFNTKCGLKARNDESPKTFPGEWCWQIAVLDSQNHFVCGGAVINDSWVLTSAHCVAAFVSGNHRLFIRAGVNDLSSVKENAVAQTRRVSKVYFHFNYDAVTLDNDIALLRLDTPLILNGNVCLTCLPSRTTVLQEGAKCTITGYGFVYPEGMLLEMKEAEVTVVDDMDCISNLTEALSTVYILPASSFCAIHKENYCQASSGNPLVCKVDEQYELTGLVSWNLGCGYKGTPTVFVKIPELMGWINHIRATDHESSRTRRNNA